MAEIVSFRKDTGAEEGGLLTRSLRDGVLRLVLNNPPANVLSIALLEALLETRDGRDGAGCARRRPRLDGQCLLRRA